MQLFTPVWLGACLASGVLASSGRVFLWDSARTVAHGLDVPSVDPETARLILAQRLGLEQFHSIPEDDGQALDLLNRFGVAGSLFETTRSASRHPRALIVIEGLEEPERRLTSGTIVGGRDAADTHSSQNWSRTIDLLSSSSAMSRMTPARSNC